MTIREIYKNSEQFLNKEVKLGGWIRSGDRRGNAGSNSAGKAAI